MVSYNNNKYLHFCIFTEKLYSKPLENNVVYILITKSGHALLMTLK